MIVNYQLNLKDKMYKQKNSQVSFKAGKVKFYSDFDLTFMPVSHRDMRKFSYDSIKLKKYFNDFKEFLNLKGKNFKFIITTGRNKSELEFMPFKLARQGVSMPLPEKIRFYWKVCENMSNLPQ